MWNTIVWHVYLGSVDLEGFILEGDVVRMVLGDVCVVFGKDCVYGCVCYTSIGWKRGRISCIGDWNVMLGCFSFFGGCGWFVRFALYISFFLSWNVTNYMHSLYFPKSCCVCRYLNKLFKLPSKYLMAKAHMCNQCTFKTIQAS